MSQTKPVLADVELKKAAQGYDRNNKPAKYINLEGFFIGPTMNSTLNDMVQYLEAQLAEKDPAIRLTHQQTFWQCRRFWAGTKLDDEYRKRPTLPLA